MWFLWLSYQHPHLSCMCFHVWERTSSNCFGKWDGAKVLEWLQVAWHEWSEMSAYECAHYVQCLWCQWFANIAPPGCAVVVQLWVKHTSQVWSVLTHPSMASFLWTKIISLFFPVLPPCHSGHQHSLRKEWCSQTTCMIDIQTCGLWELGTASHHPISGLGFQWMMKVGIYISTPMGSTFACCPAVAVDCPTTGIGYPRFLTFPSFAKSVTKDNTAWVLLLSSKKTETVSHCLQENEYMMGWGLMHY